VGGDRYGRDGVGLINLPTLERELAEGAAKQLGEFVGARTFPHVHPDQGLDLALERMGRKPDRNPAGNGQR
jgi:hypothetical protein